MNRHFLLIISIAAALVFATSSNTVEAKQSKAKKVYFLYGDARPGTKFKQKLFKDVVPFDKRYSEMSPTLQARVKSAYGGLKETEHPPFPEEGTQAIFYPLFKANRDLLAEGDVLAIAVISPEGKTKKVTVYKAPTKNIATMLTYILTNTKFDPATCDGKPCEMEYLFENRIDIKPSIAR